MRTHADIARLLAKRASKNASRIHWVALRIDEIAEELQAIVMERIHEPASTESFDGVRLKER